MRGLVSILHETRNAAKRDESDERGKLRNEDAVNPDTGDVCETAGHGHALARERVLDPHSLRKAGLGRPAAAAKSRRLRS
jgi:hypothetical protein